MKSSPKNIETRVWFEPLESDLIFSKTVHRQFQIAKGLKK